MRSDASWRPGYRLGGASDAAADARERTPRPALAERARAKRASTRADDDPKFAGKTLSARSFVFLAIFCARCSSAISISSRTCAMNLVSDRARRQTEPGRHRQQSSARVLEWREARGRRGGNIQGQTVSTRETHSLNAAGTEMIVESIIIVPARLFVWRHAELRERQGCVHAREKLKRETVQNAWPMLK
jgi:hypothetical protein